MAGTSATKSTSVGLGCFVPSPLPFLQERQDQEFPDQEDWPLRGQSRGHGFVGFPSCKSGKIDPRPADWSCPLVNARGYGAVCFSDEQDQQRPLVMMQDAIGR
ncbi:hypothetical protein PG993_011751 [Apiospora rasikravindrae]|uniref:Uncharacterized protein n=1 Tax=Apiospora rasikravindrae TaxID=990691 RepID=A0ABR1S0H6_9PEZI